MMEKLEEKRVFFPGLHISMRNKATMKMTNFNIIGIKKIQPYKKALPIVHLKKYQKKNQCKWAKLYIEK